MFIFIALGMMTPFTIYPGGSAGLEPIEAITDRGPILEMIIRCRNGSAIMSYSKLERLYCSPKLYCSGDRDDIIRRSCAGFK